MPNTIFITGSTDGIGLETARMLNSQGHHVLLHGRNPQKLEAIKQELSAEGYLADLSNMDEVRTLAKTVTEKHPTLDILINNAGIFRTSETQTADGLDTRFAVNTLAPYLLTTLLLPIMKPEGRVINLSSAAQAPVNLEALKGETGELNAMNAYAQSKLAITMWSRAMVKEGFGVAGGDLKIGADVLIRAALSDEFADATGKYFDNDAKRFANPHADALDTQKCEELIQAIEQIL